MAIKPGICMECNKEIDRTVNERHEAVDCINELKRQRDLWANQCNIATESLHDWQSKYSAMALIADDHALGKLKLVEERDLLRIVNIKLDDRNKELRARLDGIMQAHGEEIVDNIELKEELRLAQDYADYVDADNISLTEAIRFAYKHLESMDNYSIVSGTRHYLYEAIRNKSKEE